MTDASPLRWALLIAGIAVVAGTASSVLRTLVVSRGLRSLIASTTARTVQLTFRTVARRLGSYRRRDALLTWVAPVALLGFLVVWLLLFLLGYALILTAVSDVGFGTATREAGSSLFTLGFASTDRAQLTTVDFVAAATGPIVIGLLIGYLPSFYSSYNRREVEVTLLQARAGEPNWGPEILLRHQAVNTTLELSTLWSAWERWAADVSESHTAYPVLVFVRSSRPDRNWLVALLAVLDSAAMALSLNPTLPQGPPRVALRQGIVCLRDLADSQRIPYDADPDPDAGISLSFEEFAEAVSMLDDVGFAHERSAAAAWPHFRGWRVNYESIAYALADRIDAPPALWSGTRTPPLPDMPPARPVNRQPGGRQGRISPGQ